MSQPTDLDTVLMHIGDLKKHVDERLSTQDTTIGEIKTALVGNEAMGNKGIVKRLGEIEGAVAENTTWRNRIAAMAAGMGLGGGALGHTILKKLSGE